MSLILRIAPITDVHLERLSAENPGWQIERDARGSLLVSPTSSDDGARSAEALVQLALWSRGGAGGRVFDSSTGFKMRDGSVLSPDASWIGDDTLAALPRRARLKFWTTAPDVVIEVCSETDTWLAVQRKLRTYLANGTTYAIAIDPYRRDVFEIGVRPTGLLFDVESIFNA